MRSHLLRAIVVLAVGSTAGCILLLDKSPSDLAAVCRFASDQTTSCGICIAYACQKEVNACCGESTCETTLGFLDACSKSGDQCTSLFTAKDSNSPAAADLAECVSSGCTSLCEVSPATKNKAPGVKCLDESGGCQCSVVADGSNDTSCTRSVATNATCCAEDGYPEKAGTICFCERDAPCSADFPRVDYCR